MTDKEADAIMHEILDLLPKWSEGRKARVYHSIATIVNTDRTDVDAIWQETEYIEKAIDGA